MILKTCEICGTKFEASRRSQRYCKECGKNPERARRGYAHAERINRHNAGDWYTPPEKATCEECGKKFFAIYDKRFCSRECRQTHIAEELKLRCPICGALLIEKGIYHPKAIPCNPECKEKYNFQKAVQEGRYKPCEHCGKKFVAKYQEQRFCCVSCSRAWQKVNGGQRKTQRDIPCSQECQTHIKVRTLSPKEVPKPSNPANLCLACKTSQALCERFTSHFTYLPTGAVMRNIKGKRIVVSCPKYSG